MMGGMKKSNDCEWCGDQTNSPQHTICVPCAQMVEPHELPSEQELHDMAAHYELAGDMLDDDLVELFVGDEPDSIVDEYDRYDHLREE